MKNNKILNLSSLILVLSLMLITISCSDSDWIDHDLNTDPDAPANVPMNLLLPAIQQSMGYNLVGNNTVRTNNIWTQHFDGVDRQSFTEARYQLTPADVNNVWGSIYTEMFMNSTLLINKSKAEGSESPNYTGVAQVLMSTTLGISTDLFGDMPFSDAFKGSENVLRPKYDSQEQLYTSIFSMLDDAIVNLNNQNNVYEVGSDDVSYRGNISQWIKAANSIKARHALQLSKVNGNTAYQDALSAAQKGFESNADDFLVPWESANHNPIFQFMEQRGDIRMGGKLVNMMADVDDPRLLFYAAEDGDGNHTGSDAGSENVDASAPGEYNAGEESPSILMSYTELKFIEAEALLMLGLDGAQEAYIDAVAASVLRVTGEENEDWLENNINNTPVTLELIITQKYIACYSTNQPYADYRRTGFPELDLAAGATQSSIPTRFPYAQSEIDYNSENVPSVVITDKVWWDQ